MEHRVLGNSYEKNTSIDVRKSMGQYYTPKNIINYILDHTVRKANVLQNPFIKIIDISCGAGYFLIAAYDVLKEIFMLNIEELRSHYSEEIYHIENGREKIVIKGKDYWIEENIYYHILKHCIYGADKDNIAVELTKVGLLNKALDNFHGELNIVVCDSLIRWEDVCFTEDNDEENKLREFWCRKYDYVIGNPPYIGHKQLDIKYKQWLLDAYAHVFKDKSDISFCFWKRIIDILSPEGVSGIITSRYFMESPTGKQIREYLKEAIDMLEILDFYGAAIFKGVGVATAIYFFQLKQIEDHKIIIHKLRDDKNKIDEEMDLKKTIKTNLFERISVKQEGLSRDRWTFISDTSLNIYRKMEDKNKLRLKDIAISFQGIITGCDKAFVLTKDEVIANKIEEQLLKPWIKNKNIERYRILDSDLYLIYSDFIENEMDYPNSIEFIHNHKEKLENRRECKNGIRKWYGLQWGRNENLFHQPKIVFPYKSSKNRFALDYNHLYYSADVYSMVIKDEYKDRIPLKYLVGLLNSKVYEFYFKLFAKKMCKGIYDYYPNAILDMKIITEDIIDDVVYKVDGIMGLISDLENGQKNVDDINIKIAQLESDIDRIVEDYVGISSKEREFYMDYIG